MNNFLLLLITQIRRIIKRTDIMLSFIAFPIFIFIIMIFVSKLEEKKDSERIEKNGEQITSEYSVELMDSVGYFSQSENELWKQFISGGTKLNSIEEAEKEVTKQNLAIALIIPEDFDSKLKNQQKPNIKVLSTTDNPLTESTLSLLNASIDKYLLNQFIKANANNKTVTDFSAENINVTHTKEESTSLINLGLQVITLLILFIILYGASPIAIDLLNFRETKMLMRAISTPNSPLAIVLSQILAFVVCQVVINILIFFGITTFLKMKIANFGIIFLSVLLTSLFALSMALFLTRIFNKKEQISIVTNIIVIAGIIFFFLGFITILPFSGTPEIMKSLAVISPLYWILNMLDTGSLIPNLPIVIGMIAVLILASTLKLKNYSNT